MVHRRHGDNRARVAALVKDLIPNIQISHGAPSLRGRNRRIDREHLSLLLRDPDEGPAVAPPTIGPQFEEPPEQRFLPVLEDERLADPAALREAAVDLDELDDAPPVTEGHSRWLAVASRARAPVQGYDLDLQARVAYGRGHAPTSPRGCRQPRAALLTQGAPGFKLVRQDQQPVAAPGASQHLGPRSPGAA